MASKKEAKEIGIEEAMTQLDEIAAKMSRPDITLEESFFLYNKGVDLVKYSKNLLTGVEKKLKILEEEEMEEKQNG